jgi:nitroreductase
MAAKTPSSFNLQPWSLIVLETKDDKLRLQKHAMNQEKVSQAPVTMIVLGDRDGWRSENPFVEKLFQENIKAGTMAETQRDWFDTVRTNLYGKSNDTIQAFANKNAGFFAMTLMFAAKSLGLDSHPMDGFDVEGVRKEFCIPDNYWIPLLISIGYFDETKKLSPPNWRKSYEDIVVRF